MNDCYFEKKDWRACKFEVSDGFDPFNRVYSEPGFLVSCPMVVF